MKTGYACPYCNRLMIHKYKNKEGYRCFNMKCKQTFTEPIKRLVPKANGKPKRQTYDLAIMTRNELLHRINLISSVKVKAFMCMLYLTGARINEICKKVKNYEVEIKTLNGKRYVVVNNVIVLKRRKKVVRRNIPISIEHEKPFLQPLMNYANGLKPEVILFDFSSIYGYQMVRKWTGMFPHYFRHLRLTHLASDYGFNSQELKQLTGLTNDTPASTYVHLNWQDIAKKM